MITSDRMVEPDIEVVFTEMQNGESVLLHLGTGHYFSLNQTGTIIWQLLEKGLTVAEISQALVEQFEVSEEQALQSVVELVDEMAGERLVHVSDGPAGGANTGE